MKLPFDLKQISVLKKIKFNITLILLIFLGFVMLMVSFVIYSEITKITSLRTDEDAAKNQMIRVNQDLYRQLEERLNDNASFIPQTIPNANVFSAAPKVDNKR